MCGYNWKKENLIEKAMSPWASFVGKKYRKMSIDEFALSDEIQSIVNEFVPKLDFSKTTISNSPRGATGFSR